MMDVEGQYNNQMKIFEVSGRKNLEVMPVA
jgi:hypothetical protein